MKTEKTLTLTKDSFKTYTGSEGSHLVGQITYIYIFLQNILYAKINKQNKNIYISLIYTFLAMPNK